MAGQERCTPPREHIDRTAPRSALWLPIRETATLDRLSSGRLTLGVGLGSDRFGSELSKTGEQLDDRLRGPDARRGTGDPHRRLVRCAGAPPRRALHRGGHLVPAPTGAAARGAGVGRGIPRQQQAAAPGRPPRRLLPANLEHPDQLAEIVATIASTRRPVRLRSRSPTRHRPGALGEGRRHLVAGRVPVGHGVGGPCTGRAPRRPGGSLNHE